MDKRNKRIVHSETFIRKLKAKKAAFLTAFRNLSLQGKACVEIGISQDAVADWRESDPDFERAYLKAELRLLPKLHDQLVDRVLNGVERGIYYEGAKVATEREFSDKLLLAAIAARDPRYRNVGSDQPIATFQPASIVVNVHPGKPPAVTPKPPK